MKNSIHLLTLLAVFLLIQDAVCNHKHKHFKNEGKIVGGYNATIQNFPYQVYLLLKKGNDNYQCGGSILNNLHVLTAAHCLTGIQLVTVRAGSTYASKDGTTITSRIFSQHPKYNTKTSDYDVGVVRLSKRLTLDGKTTKAITLVSGGSSIPAGSNVTVSGWGTTSENGQISETLMAVSIPVVSNADCAKSYGNTITSRMFCAGVPEGGKDSCQGDSGGPVVLSSGQQAGVVSFGIGCARKGTPGVYSFLGNSEIRNWIKSQSGV